MTYKVYKKGNFLEVVDTNNGQIYNARLADARIKRHDTSNVWYDFYKDGEKFLSKIFLNQIVDENDAAYLQQDFEDFIYCSFGKTIIGDSCEGLFNIPQDGQDGNYTVVTQESAGLNCQYGGVKIEVLSGLDNSVLSTNYVCNGAPSESVLHSEHPNDSSSGLLVQTLGNLDGYELGVIEDLPNGTIWDMEFELKCSEGVTVIPGDADLSFLLNESIVEIPRSFEDGFNNAQSVLPIKDDETYSCITRIVLTKISNTEAHYSINHYEVDENFSFAYRRQYHYQKTVAITTAPSINEKIEVRVRPHENPVTLIRVIIKRIIPQ